MTDTLQLTRIIREKDLHAYTGLSRSQIYTLMNNGEFPKPVPLTDAGSRKGWLETEVIAWQQRRVAARENAA